MDLNNSKQFGFWEPGNPRFGDVYERLRQAALDEGIDLNSLDHFTVTFRRFPKRPAVSIKVTYETQESGS